MSVVSNTSLEFTLREGANALGLDLSEAQITQLLDFLALLQKWNKVYNLTAVRDPQEMLTHHLLDSLAAVPPLRRHVAQRGQDSAARPGARLLDVGSGGGLPGVVFAICCPEVDVSCVDTVAKKAAFIQQAAGTLGLSNLRGIHARVETLAGPFDVVSCRAFAALADFTAWSRQALAPHGVWLAMKGKHPHDEIAALPADVSVFHVEPLTVPGLQAERCILWLRPVA
ncbi:16S rRNA (guanine(527)-N(7))-methyltransferase RsmG [Diaphorobacter sp. LR2014-1]|uniref:16S rRNA (guanine(527)-N(7))-methyltransferase RsmG n=1 Tax=Diaphorobacter sp. LR2014-1 TaxID=1933219 RepID=UPI000CDAF408|nr:16S rRNA (guanine(527)-N(7))-methyltransferase RsmG [Diaphorobacter sp. LR2014-1]POR12857.1 16S rRNA (guanine(527)-N(7))-methyltransferase RsmG [Diaphorobacter sp. LR2014-1]